jgi:hypothetical protein
VDERVELVQRDASERADDGEPLAFEPARPARQAAHRTFGVTEGGRAQTGQGDGVGGDCRHGERSSDRLVELYDTSTVDVDPSFPRGRRRRQEPL